MADKIQINIQHEASRDGTGVIVSSRQDVLTLSATATYTDADGSQVVALFLTAEQVRAMLGDGTTANG